MSDPIKLAKDSAHDQLLSYVFAANQGSPNLPKALPAIQVLIPLITTFISYLPQIVAASMSLWTVIQDLITKLKPAPVVGPTGP